MTTNHRHLTRALMIAGLAVGAWTATELADLSAAHADDRPAAAEQPGGLLGGVVDLPEQIVEEVAPEPEPPAEPEPELIEDESAAGEDQGDEPATDDRPTDPPTAADPIAEAPPVEPAPAVTDPAPVAPAPAPPATPTATPTTAPAAPVKDAEPAPATLPASDPSPLPDGENHPAPVPPALVVPAAVPTSALQLLTGPTPTTRAAHAPPAGTDAATALQAILCADEDDSGDMVIPLKRIKQTTKPATATASRHGKPCPGTPGNPADTAAGVAQVKPPPPTAADLIGEPTAALTQPALARLGVLRARSAIPVGRSVHLDPRPA